MTFFIGLYRRYYLWSHKAYRETKEIFHIIKMLLKAIKGMETTIKSLEHMFLLDKNVETRVVLIEKFTNKDKQKERIQIENDLSFELGIARAKNRRFHERFNTRR